MGDNPSPDLLFNVRNDRKTIHSLIEAGADIHARNEDGNTTLLCAAQMNSVRTVEILLEYGANAEDKDHSGSTALMKVVHHVEVTR